MEREFFGAIFKGEEQQYKGIREDFGRRPHTKTIVEYEDDDIGKHRTIMTHSMSFLQSSHCVLVYA